MVNRELGPKAKSELIGKCREARNLILRDAEAFLAGAQLLEQIGQVLSGTIESGLGGYKETLWFVCSKSEMKRADFDALFRVVKDARNDAAHDGAWARNLGSRLVDLLLAIEAGLMTEMTFVKDVMVLHPLAAEEWHLLNTIRKTMLETSFSYLPYYQPEAGWSLLSEMNLMRFLKSKKLNLDKKTSPRGLTVSAAVKPHGCLALIPAKICTEDESIADVIERFVDGPLLVIDPSHPERLIGILSAFDLL